MDEHDYQAQQQVDTSHDSNAAWKVDSYGNLRTFMCASVIYRNPRVPDPRVPLRNNFVAVSVIYPDNPSRSLTWTMKDTDMTESRGLAKAIRTIAESDRVPKHVPIDLTIDNRYLADIITQGKILELEERGWGDKANRDVLVPLYVALEEREAPVFLACINKMQSKGNPHMKYAQEVADLKVSNMTD